MVFITISHGKYLGIIELMCKYNCAFASASKLSQKGFKAVLEIDVIGTFVMSQQVFN